MFAINHHASLSSDNLKLAYSDHLPIKTAALSRSSASECHGRQSQSNSLPAIIGYAILHFSNTVILCENEDGKYIKKKNGNSSYLWHNTEPAMKSLAAQVGKNLRHKNTPLSLLS